MDSMTNQDRPQDMETSIISEIWKESKGRCLVSDTILGQQSCVNYNARHTADQPDACFWLCEMGVICRRAQ